jgi:hypothetical protein
MDKPANVVLHFNKAREYFWLPMIDKFDTKTINEADGEVFVLFPVKGYSLEDHQFIKVTIEINKKEAVVWIPRSIVSTIVEGKADMRTAFSFPGSKLS